MKKSFLFVLLSILLFCGTISAQVIAPNPVSSQLPMEILVGLMGKYAAMIEQYQALIASGGKPDSDIQFRLAASINLPEGINPPEGGELDPLLASLSKTAFWLNTNVFAKYPSHIGISLMGTFGDVELLVSQPDTIVISRDEAVFSVLPRDILGSLDTSSLPIDPSALTNPSLDQLQAQLILLLAGLASVDMEYEGVRQTPRGMAHIVKLIPADTANNMVASLWILDETWDLYEIEFYDAIDNINITLIVERIDLDTSLPDERFSPVTSDLAEVSYDDFIKILELKTLSVSLRGAPVVADLSTSSKGVRLGEQATVFSNGLDSDDLESELDANIEYRGPDGVWMPLDAIYEGDAPLGFWKADFSPDQGYGTGSYDLRVTYTDPKGNSSETFYMASAFEVIVPPPVVVSTKPFLSEKGVSVETSITIVFSQEMNKESVEAAFSLIEAGKIDAPGYFEWSDKTLTFKPVRNLNYGQSYTAKLLGSAMSLASITLDGNLNGIAEGTPADDVMWSFTVEQAPVPKIVTTEPVDKQINVPVSAQIAVNFSEDMDQASVEGAFSVVSDKGKTITGSFQWSNSTLALIPVPELEYNASYTVKILGSAKSLKGIGLDGNGNGIADGSPADDAYWSFSTEKALVLSANVKPEKATRETAKSEVITVEVSVENASSLDNFSFNVNFDPSIMDAFKVKRESFFNWRPKTKYTPDADASTSYTIDNKKGVISVSSINLKGLIGTGKVVTIMFQTIGIGESPIAFDNISFIKTSGDPVSPNLLGSKVVVKTAGLWDANGDGVVDIKDFIISRSEADMTADVNGDKVIDILDMVTGKPNIRLWDTNGDGIVDIADFIKVMKSNGFEPDVNGDGVIDILDVVAMLSGAVGSPEKPVANALGINYPNPFNPDTWIPFKLADSADVVLSIYSSGGQLVRTIDLGYRHAGVYTNKATAIHWDGTNEKGEKVASGVYFYNIRAGNFSATRKMMVIE